jgi:hypothetical protein
VNVDPDPGAILMRIRNRNPAKICMAFKIYLAESVQHRDDGVPPGLDIQAQCDLLSLCSPQLILKYVVSQGGAPDKIL